jgi:hypothetical protein
MRIFHALVALLPLSLQAQIALTFDPSVPVTRNGQDLQMAWAGGVNFSQFSDIDLDDDGDKDLWLFDRSGNKVITLRNDGVPGENSYTFVRDHDDVYPFNELKEWALLRDYNCDGKEDIFSYSLGGFAVYKNTSSGGNLSFVEVDTLVRSNYVPTEANLYITQVDIPGIEDIDGDGDMDVITFSIFGSTVEFHRNMSVELYGICDSLVYEVRNRCWGFFTENLNNNTVELDNPCSSNVPDPQVTEEIERATLRLQRDRFNPNAEAERAHVGSTELPIDLDGDNDKDLLLGDVLFTNILALTNGGNADSAYMVAQDSLYPIYDESVHLEIFPATFYEDVDNDGKRDLLVTPNYPSLSHNFQSVWYYHNDGTDAVPLFNKLQEDLFQERMIDLGEGAYPVPFDFNGDGLMDVIVANYGYFQQGGTYPCKMAALKNVGTVTQPAFTLFNDDYQNFSTMGIGNAMYPAFGDLDGDGDKDLYIGDLQGKLHHFENTTSDNTAVFTLTDPIVVDENSTAIDVGQFATPQFFDVDGDNLLDMLIGERNGNVNYWRNVGNATAPVWHLENDSVGGVNSSEWWNITGYSVPLMYLNNDGDRELLLGSEDGWIRSYNNIEGNLNGTWTEVDTTWQGLHEGERTAVCLHDFTNDGFLDAVIGNYRGGLSYWRNDFGLGTGAEGLMADEAFHLLPNPANDQVTVQVNIPADGTFRLELLNELGQVLSATRVQDKRMQMNTRVLDNGVYFIRLSNGNARWTQRLAVVH